MTDKTVKVGQEVILLKGPRKGRRAKIIKVDLDKNKSKYPIS